MSISQFLHACAYVILYIIVGPNPLNVYKKQGGHPFERMAALLLLCAPGMGDNLVVQVHYALGSRKR